MHDYQCKAYNWLVDARQQHTSVSRTFSESHNELNARAPSEVNVSDQSPCEDSIFNNSLPECSEESSSNSTRHDEETVESLTETVSLDGRVSINSPGVSERYSVGDSSLTNRGISRTPSVTFSRQTTDINHSVVSKIQTLVDQLETMFTMTYEQLDSNSLPDEVQRTLRSTVENSFYEQLWPHVTVLYRFAVSLINVLRNFSNAWLCQCDVIK